MIRGGAGQGRAGSWGTPWGAQDRTQLHQLGVTAGSERTGEMHTVVSRQGIENSGNYESNNLTGRSRNLHEGA